MFFSGHFAFCNFFCNFLTDILCTGTINCMKGKNIERITFLRILILLADLPIEYILEWDFCDAFDAGWEEGY